MQRVSWYCHWPRRVSTDCSRRSFQSGIGQEHGLESLRIYSVICCINTFYTTDRCFWTCYKNKWKFLYTICISLATQSTVQSNVIFLLNITSLFSALLPTSPRQNMAIQLLQQHRCQTLSLLPNVITWHYFMLRDDFLVSGHEQVTHQLMNVAKVAYNDLYINLISVGASAQTPLGAYKNPPDPQPLLLIGRGKRTLPLGPSGLGIRPLGRRA